MIKNDDILTGLFVSAPADIEIPDRRGFGGKTIREIAEAQFDAAKRRAEFMATLEGRPWIAFKMPYLSNGVYADAGESHEIGNAFFDGPTVEEEFYPECVLPELHEARRRAQALATERDARTCIGWRFYEDRRVFEYVLIDMRDPNGGCYFEFVVPRPWHADSADVDRKAREQRCAKCAKVIRLVPAALMPVATLVELCCACLNAPAADWSDDSAEVDRRYEAEEQAQAIEG
jgi:hypothetical protein